MSKQAKQYRLHCNFLRGGKMHPPGAILDDLSGADIKALGNMVELVDAGGAAEGGEGGDMTVAEAIAALQAQVNAGEATAEAAYTAAGAPDCAALSRIAGRKISAAERDAALAEAQAAGGDG